MNPSRMTNENKLPRNRSIMFRHLGKEAFVASGSCIICRDLVNPGSKFFQLKLNVL
jgi:hypothetical protein